MVASSVLPLRSHKSANSRALYPHAQWWFLLSMVTTWVGFGRSYFATIRTQPLLHHVHGALMGAWIATLIAQPMLYQTGRMKLHRLLGRYAAFLLVPAVMICGFLMVRGMLRATEIPPFMVDHLAFLDLCSLALFPSFVWLAVWYRRNLQLHARYITCTVVLLMPPAIVRAMFLLPFLRFSFRYNVNVSMLLMDLVLLVLIADDQAKGRIRAAYPIALLSNTAVAIAASFASEWGWWHALRAWIAG